MTADHVAVKWPPDTEGERGCGPHCTEPPADPLAASAREALRGNLDTHCPCHRCHHAFHRCHDTGRTYAWFAGRWAELLTAEPITPDTSRDPGPIAPSPWGHPEPDPEDDPDEPTNRDFEPEERWS
jgi:hypothetical protein